jgi:hypothetical protein
MTPLNSIPFRSFENFTNSAHTFNPKLLKCAEKHRRPTQCLSVCVHDLLTASALLGDEVRPFEHGDVLLHSGETHLVLV